MTKNHALKVIGLFSSLFMMMANVSVADDKVDCDAYARITVQQAKEAKQRGCGLSGPVWSLDYSFHKTWCLKSNVHMADLTRENNLRLAGLQQCKDTSSKKYDAWRAKQKACLVFAKKAQKLRTEINKACPSDGEWPVPLKQDVDHCMKNGGANKVNIENVKRTGKIASCQAAGQKAKLQVTRTFPHSGKKGTRRKRFLPVDVCLRKFYKDGSWVFGLGGGITDVPAAWECGKRVADAFCITNGYVEAIKYPVKVYDNGSDMDGRFASTYWIGSKKACHGKCAGFSSITCKGKL